MRQTKNPLTRAALVVAVAGLTTGAAAFGANNLTVPGPGQGLNGTQFAMQVNLEPGQTNNVFVQTNHPESEEHYLMRFWVDPSDLDLPGDTGIRIGAINSTENGQRLLLFIRRDVSPGNDIYQLNAWGLEDTGGFRFLQGVFLTFTASPTPVQVEVEWTRSSGPAVADAIYRVARLSPSPGGPAPLSNLVMRNFDVDFARFGVIAGSGGVTQTNSSYKFDEFESYR